MADGCNVNLSLVATAQQKVCGQEGEIKDITNILTLPEQDSGNR